MSLIKQFSTWDMDGYPYLDCLPLSTAVRGQESGFKLMRTMKYFAKGNKLKNIQWQTLTDNAPAIEFHQKLGAVNENKQRFFWAI
jgi:RimJ/RimL family protein N-acetyltransferase